jgi:hypothetical protein
MAKYSVNTYGSSRYGTPPLLRYSVRPMAVLVSSIVPDVPSISTVEFRKAIVTWQTPSGEFTRIRLVRSQVGFPETAEDGVIIFDEIASEGEISTSYFVDGEDNPNDITLIPGRQVYYRIFLFTDEKIWVVAGEATAIIPSDHGAQRVLLNSLPKVFTTSEQSPLGVVDETSNLYDFLWGFAFTQEEFYTLIDLLRPRHTGLETPYELIPAERTNLGLEPEQGLPTKNQKRLIREANYMYSRKGIKSAIETYAESLTGFAPDITVSENLLLTVQDSTFYKGIGNWSVTNATIAESVDLDAKPGTNVIDVSYSGKIIASNSGTATLGGSNPVTQGVPVKPLTEYTVSCQLRSPASAGNISISVQFYDKNNQSTSSANTSTVVSANNTWKQASVTATTDETSSYAVLRINYSAAGTYYIDQVCAQLGDTVVYDEARAVDIFLSPSKTNYIHNPSFEVNVTDGWTKVGTATVTQDVDVSDIAYSGEKSAKIVATGPWTYTSNTMPIFQGTYYTASGLIKSNANLQVTFVGRDEYGDVVVTEDAFNIGTTTNWSRFSTTHLIDALDAGVATYELVFEGNTGTYYLDCIQFEKGTKASDYFDGSLPASFGVVWEGTADDSHSHLYPNKPTKVPRLGKTLIDWLPMNTFWRLRTYAGIEYTNLTV